MRKLLHLLSALVILACFVLMAIQFYMLYWPVRLLEAKTPLPILTAIPEKGKDLLFEFDYCRYTLLDAVGTRQIICTDRIYPLPDVKGNAPMGCNKGIRSVVLPPSMDNGTCYLHFSSTFQVNPLRLKTLIFDSESFQVK